MYLFKILSLMLFFIKLTEKKRKLRIRQIDPKIYTRFKILICIKNDLVRCCKNIITITKDEMKTLRRKLFDIKNEEVCLTTKEFEVSSMNINNDL